MVPKVELDFDIISTGEHIHFERIGMTGFFYINGVLETTVDYGNTYQLRANIPNSIKNLGFSATNGFSLYYYSGSEDWVANQIEGMVADKAIAVIIGALTGALPYYIVGMLSSSYNSAKGLHDFATLHKVFSDKALRAVNIFYGSYNSQCNRLAYYGAKAYLLKKAWSPEIDVSSG